MKHVSVPGLSRFPCILRGGWDSPARMNWSARATSAQPLVGVNILVAQGCACWSKSARLADDADAVRIGLGLDSSDPRHVTIASGWIALPTRLADPHARPDLPQHAEIETGTLWRLCAFDATPAIEIFLLLVSAADVRFGRNQLWRLRSASAVGAPFDAMLRRARSGECAWAIGTLEPG